MGPTKATAKTFRCMTCDRLSAGTPFMAELTKDETIGVCEPCAKVLRSYLTMKALAEEEYDKVV